MKRYCLIATAMICSLCAYCGEQISSGENSSSHVGVNMDNYVEGETDALEALIIEPNEVSESIDEPVEIESENKMQDGLTPGLDYKQSKYWGRYTALRTAGWTTFGVGVGFLLGGYTMILGAWGAGEDAGVGLAYAGMIMVFSAPVLVLTSIPLLGCAYWNRYKAKKMTLDVGASFIPSMKTSPFKTNTSTPALSFALNF